MKNQSSLDQQANDTLMILADIVETLQSSGAHNARIIRNTERIAKGLHYHMDLVLHFSGFVLTIYPENSDNKYTLSRAIKTRGINFETVSEVSILSWDVLENNISLTEIKSILSGIKQKIIYSKLFLKILISLASVSLCFVFDGDLIEALISFIATFCGFSVLLFLRSKHYNPYFSIFLVTVVSVSIIHICGILLNLKIIESLAVSVLYLVPGVFLINSFIDFLENYVEAGISKMLHSSLIISALSSGFFVSNYLFEHIVLLHHLIDLSSVQKAIAINIKNIGLWVLLLKYIFGGVTSLGFAILFNTPKRALWVVFILGGIGYSIKYFLNIELEISQIMAVFCASCLVGISGMYFAHRIHTPPLVFTIPAVINMIPGLLCYKFMIGMINWTMKTGNNSQNADEVLQTFNYGVSATFIVFALAFGVAISVIVFKNHTVKGKDLNKLIELYFKRN